MTRDFLGTGWAFPVRADHRGDIELSGDAIGIEESIRLILGTAKGERIMRPEFGCEIHDEVFSRVTPTTLSVIESEVRDALVRWEPRIDVRDVEASQDEVEPNRILIEIDYRVRSTNSPANTVYPFYLTESTE